MASNTQLQSGLSGRRAAPVVVAVAILLAAVAGAATDLSGTYVVAGVIALLGGLLMFVRPILGMVVFAASIPVETLLVFGDVTATRLLGLAVFAAWAGRKLLLGESWKPLVRTGTAIAACLFIVWVLLSMLWAEHPHRSLIGFAQLVQLAVLSLLIVDLCSSWERLDALVKAVVVGAWLAALLTIQQSLTPGVRRAGDDIAGGINETAILLLTAVPFAFYLIRSHQNVAWRLAGVVYVAASGVAISQTFSRMNMLLFPFTLAVLGGLTLLEGRGRRWLIGLVAGGIVAAAFMPWEDLRERASTITDYMEGTVAATSADAGDTSERGYHLRVGLAIASDHPIIGAGYNNFGELFRSRYQFIVPGVSRYYGSVRSPHSSFVGLLADVGVVGMFLWVGVLLTAGWSLFGAWRRLRRLPAVTDGLLLVESVSLAFFLHAVPYGFYTPNQKEKIIWLLIGMAVAIGVLVRRDLEEPGVEEFELEYTEDRADPGHRGAGVGPAAVHRV